MLLDGFHDDVPVLDVVLGQHRQHVYQRLAVDVEVHEGRQVLLFDVLLLRRIHSWSSVITTTFNIFFHRQLRSLIVLICQTSWNRKETQHNSVRDFLLNCFFICFHWVATKLQFNDHQAQRYGETKWNCVFPWASEAKVSRRTVLITLKSFWWLFMNLLWWPDSTLLMKLFNE